VEYFQKDFVSLVIIIWYNGNTLKVKELGAMKFIISGKNIEVTEGIRAAIEEKLGRLDKYLVDDTIINVTSVFKREDRRLKLPFL
jgi:uncharacterized Zn finger protein